MVDKSSNLIAAFTKSRIVFSQLSSANNFIPNKLHNEKQ